MCLLPQVFSFSHCLSTAPTFHLMRIFLAWITSCSHTPSRLMQVSAHPYLGVQICSKLCRVCMLYVIPYMCLIFSTHQVVHITGKISGSRNGDRQKYGRQVDSICHIMCADCTTSLTIFHCTDILDVFPRNGSTEGGTQISITLNVPIFNNTNNIKVFVGGESISCVVTACCSCHNLNGNIVVYISK